MNGSKPNSTYVETTAPFATALAGEHRDRVLLEEAAAAQRRQHDLLEQTSLKHPPEIRIRIWEQLHQIRLPREPAHRLLSVIAAQTDLSVAQVNHEQHRRAAARVAASSKQ